MTDGLPDPQHPFPRAGASVGLLGGVLGIPGGVVDGCGGDEDEGVDGAGDVGCCCGGEGEDVVEGKTGGEAEGVGEGG